MKTIFYLLGGIGIGAIYGLYYEYRDDPLQAKFFCDTPYQVNSLYESYKRKRDLVRKYFPQKNTKPQTPVDVDD